MEPTSSQPGRNDIPKDDTSIGLAVKEMKEIDWDAPAPDMKNLRTAGAVVGASIAVILGFTAPFVFTKTVLPYMATPGPKIRSALQHLEKANTNKNVFVDLGSGDGEAVYQAAKLGYKAVGVELNFTMWALSSARRRLFWSTAERANSTFLWSNFFDYDLKDANTIMVFGVTPLMKSISQKIATECPPGTDVLSYRFGLPLQHRGKESAGLLRADIIYDEQEMRIYRSK